MTRTVRFQPVPVPGELLRPGVTQRPTLLLNDENNDICLGRNANTGIADLRVHRKLARLRLFPQGRVFLHVDPGDKHHSTITINGNDPQWKRFLSTEGVMVELYHGDLIALDGRDDSMPLRYSYKVWIEKETAVEDLEEVEPKYENAQLAVGAAVASAAPSAASACKSLGEEFMCPLCMDVQVQSRLLVPCGHSFCHGCVTPSPATCPICRGPVQSQTPNLILDNVIWKMMEAQSSFAAAHAPQYFETDDIRQYSQRTGKELKQPATQPTLGTQKKHQQLQPHLQPSQELPQDEQPPRRAPKRKRVIDVDDSEIPTGVGTSPDNAICLDD